MTEATPKKSNNILKKAGRIVLKTFLFLILFVILVLALILTPPVQRFATRQAENFLEKKLKTRVDIGKIYIGFPKDVVMDNIYLEDRQKDTLLYGGSIRVDLDMWKLFSNEFQINQVKVESVTAKVKRQLPDTAFNFQFIIDAFVTEQAKPATTDTATLKMDVRYVQFDKIRLIYQDVITGNDMSIWLGHFDTRIDKFDPAHMAYDIPETNISGFTAKIYQSKPLMEPEPLAKDLSEAKQPVEMDLKFKALNLKDINLDYRNDVSAMYTMLNLGELKVNANNLDLKKRLINLDDLNLNNTTATIRFGRKPEARVVTREVSKEVQAEVQNPWVVRVNAVRFDNNNIVFDDDNKPRLGRGMDYAHLNARGITLHVNDLLFSPDSMAGNITKASMKEQSGFQLNNWQTSFLYTNNQAYLKDMLLETPGTLLRRSVILKYPSIESLQTNIGALQMDVDIRNSKIQVKDILTFAPYLAAQPAFKNPNSVWRVNGRILGSVSRLELRTLQLAALQDTRVDVNGIIYGLPDPNNVRADLNIRDLSSSRRDIVSVVPAGTIPPNINIPERIKLTGKLRGGMTGLNTDLVINSTSGSASIAGSLMNPTDPRKSQYNMAIRTRSLNLGSILQNPQLGTVTARFTARGRGFDPKYANADIKGVVESAVLNKYNYKNLQFDATIANQQFQAKANIRDPNIDLALNASADLSAEFPAVRLVANVDSIKMLPLNFTTQPVLYRGQITGDFPVTDPDRLHGNLVITKSILVANDQRIQFDSIQVNAGSNDSGQYINLSSDIANLNLQGQYKLTQLGYIFQQAIQPYFALIPDYKVTPVDPYDFTIRGNIVNKPLFKAFLPDLQRMETIVLDSRFSSNNGWTANISAPSTVIGVNAIQNVQLQVGTGNNALNLKATVEKFQSGKSMSVYGTTLTATVANNIIDFGLNIKDKIAKDKYTLSGLFQQPSNGTYVFSLKPGDLLLNYEKWTITGDNKITIAPEGINANNFVLSHGAQQLRINSLNSTPTAPMEVSFASFRLATLANFVQSDSLMVNGALNGRVVLENLMTQPVFTGDLTINDLTVKQDTIGNLRMLVNNTVQNTYAADITLSGQGNDLQLAGNYYVKPANQSSFDFTLDIRQILLNTIEGATMGAITNASGALNGKFAVKGTLAKPSVNGNLKFNQAAFSITMLNSYYAILNDAVSINDEGIHFDTFTIRDSANNTAVLDGSAYTTNFSNYRFDLTFTADNFMALNSVKRPNDLYYGKLLITSQIRVTGNEKQPVVDGTLDVNPETRLTIVLPQQQPGVVDREGIIKFVDMDAIPEDSSIFARYDTLNTSDLVGMDISANLNISKEAEFNLIIDEGTGDFIRVKGEALLTGGIDPSGKVTLSGSYELDQGSYELSFNFLKRKFDIQKGSRIVWTGEPTNADLDVTAIYTANTAPLDLVQNQLESQNPAVRNTYLQKLPFQVFLKITGELLKPVLAFDIDLPEDQNFNVSRDIINNVNTKLDQIRQEPSELNKQVFALLLLNRFVTENPFESSGGGMTASGFARQSVSKLLTEQLNRLASDLIEGVDINFGVQSSDDYTTGERRDRTDFNVGLSKRLLNDRLVVSVGSNFELEGPTAGNQRSNNLAGNINVDYKLSKDGRYALRAYRKNEYEGVLDGYIVETGLGFVITVDYNRLRQIFMSKEDREEKRKIRRENRELEKKEQEKKEKEQQNTTETSPADDRRKEVTIANANSND